jgi:predicted PurR-regulated permease PerM
MTLRNHLIFWGAAFAALIGFIVLFKSILMPFVLGIAVAYLLNPLVNSMGRLKIGRGPASIFILGTFFLVVAALVTVLAPIFYRQALQLSDDLPGYLDSTLDFIEPYIHQALTLIGADSTDDIKDMLKTQAGSPASFAPIFKGIVAGGQTAFDLIVFMPIVAYFMMKEWPHIIKWGDSLLPRDHKKTILDLLSQIDTKISGFVRGQISVAVILGFSYAIALSIAGLNYGFLIGLLAGLMSIIPMAGSTVGLLVSVLVAWFQTGDLMFVGIVAAIFLVGQLIEGNILTPKIVGESVGLHPLWVFFALLAGGSLFGILGMLIAVPVAAIAGVLLAFAIAQYKLSPYFKGEDKNSDKKDTKSKKATK